MFVEPRPDSAPDGGAEVQRQPDLSQHHEARSAGQDIAERLRFLNTSEYQVDHRGILPDLNGAIALINARQMSPRTAREIVGATHELEVASRGHGDQTIGPLLDELKMAVYGTTDVHPQVLHDQRRPGELEGPLRGERTAFEWHGTPIRLRVLDDTPGEPDSTMPVGQGPHGSPDITLRLGEHGTWLMQLGAQVPFPLAPDAPFRLGRRQLGKNTNVSREGHVTLQATSQGIEVTGKAGTNTHFTTSDYPDPATWNLRRYMDDDRRRDEHAARERLDRA